MSLDEDKRTQAAISRLWLVPFVGGAVGAPERVEGNALVAEAAIVAARGEGVFVAAKNAQEAHRLARRMFEARTLIRELRESAEAYREGYAAALGDLRTFLRSEVEHWQGEGATPVADEIRAARHEVIEQVSSFIAGRS